MGIDIERVDFDESDMLRFKKKLKQQLAHLQKTLDNPNFGTKTPSIGAELELYLIDQQGRPLPQNETVLNLASDPLLTPELNSYNLEYNFSPCPINNKPFENLEKAMVNELASLNQLAKTINGRIAAIGILPTLIKSDFGPHSMTQRKRYSALVNELIRKRGGNFNININGLNPLKFDLADITLEGANTSFQIHYPVSINDYVDTFNSVQLLTPIAVALGANAPTLFGHHLWDETRIPLFKQSIDTRHVDRYEWNEPPRVVFGHGWMRQSPHELFSEAVNLYEPILPICTKNNDHQGVASLNELKLHLGTVWYWNRPVYDHIEHGHLRIEMRALPSGPTAVDMVANAAFLIGVSEAMKREINDFLPAIPFSTAEYNFYRAAQFSFDAKLIWPQKNGGYCKQDILCIMEAQVPLAYRGLKSIGIGKSEIKRYLDIIQHRIETKQNGASWQKQTLIKFYNAMSKTQALHEMLACYLHNSSTNIPVSEWKIGEKL